MKDKTTKCDQYRKQLGGMQAAYNRLKQHNKSVEALALDMFNIISHDSTYLEECQEFAKRLNDLKIHIS